MDTLTGPPGLPLWRDYPRFVRRHAVPIGLLAGLGLLLGLGWGATQPASYSATASVMLAPVPKYVTPATGTLLPPAVTIDTDAQLVGSAPVLAAVAEELDEAPETVRDRIGLTASPHTRVLHVTVTAPNPDAAARAANAAVTTLGDVRRASLGALRDEQLRQLRFLIEHRERELTAEGVVVAAYDPATAQVLDLRSELEDLEAARRLPLEIVAQAEPPPHADHANTEVPAVSGAMAGLLCGCLLGTVRDRARLRAPRRASVSASPSATTDEDLRHDD